MQVISSRLVFIRLPLDDGNELQNNSKNMNNKIIHCVREMVQRRLVFILRQFDEL